MPEPTPIPPSAVGDTHPVEPGNPGGVPPLAVPPTDDNKGNPPVPPADVVPKKDYEEVVGQRDRNYARLKKAEEKLKEKGISLDEQPPTTPPSASPAAAQDPFSLAKVVSVLKDFDGAEIDMIQKLAKADNVTPERVIQDQNFKIWLKGKREEDLKAKAIPSPSGSSPSGMTPDAAKIGTMSKEEHAQYEREFIAKQRGGRGV